MNSTKANILRCCRRFFHIFFKWNHFCYQQTLINDIILLMPFCHLSVCWKNPRSKNTWLLEAKNCWFYQLDRSQKFYDSNSFKGSETSSSLMALSQGCRVDVAPVPIPALFIFDGWLIQKMWGSGAIMMDHNVFAIASSGHIFMISSFNFGNWRQ